MECHKLSPRKVPESELRRADFNKEQFIRESVCHIDFSFVNSWRKLASLTYQRIDIKIILSL